MSPIFDEHDSPVKKTAIVLFWIVAAVVILKIASLVLSGVVALLPFVVLFTPAVWVYWHAQKRGEARPLLWALLTLFTWLIGLVIYLIVHPENGIQCPSCGAKVERNFATCPSCGADLRSQIWNCRHCGKSVKTGWIYCAHCGRELEQAKIPEHSSTDNEKMEVSKQ